MITDKSINVHTPVEAATAEAGGLAFWQSLADGQPNRHVPKPPPPHKSSIVAAAGQGLSGPQCNPHVPKCSRSRQAEKEQQVEENDKAVLTRKNHISI